MMVVDATTAGDWVELFLASDVTCSGPSVIIEVTGDNAFIDISNSHFYAYLYTGEILKVVSGAPKVNYRGAHILASGPAGQQPAVCRYASDIRQGQDDGTPTVSPWTAASGNVVLTVSTGTGEGGGNAIRATWSGSASASFSHRVDIRAGQILQAEAKVNVISAPGSTTVYWRVEWYDVAGGMIRRDIINRSGGMSAWTATTGAFELISTWKRAPAGCAYAIIQFWNTTTAAVIDIDKCYAWVL